MATNDLFELLTRVAISAGCAVTTIPGERIIGNIICVRVNEKRCVARLTTAVIKPPGNTFGNVRFSVRNSETESDSDIKAIVLVVAPPNEKAVFYIIPLRDCKTILREQGRSTRSGKGSSPTLNVPHPPQANSRLEPYRDNWKALA